MVARPRIRASLTEHDLSALASEIAIKAPHLRPELDYYLRDGRIDDIFRSDRIRAAVLSTSPRNISRFPLHLYFLIATTDSLATVGLDDLDFADYIASLLWDFATIERSSYPLGPEYPSFITIAEMLAAANTATPGQRDYLYVLTAEFMLWLLGLWSDHVRWRRERFGAPDLGYYESIGKSLYSYSAESSIATNLGMTNIYRQAASHFTLVRIALNEVADRCSFASGPEDAIERILQRSTEITNAKS